ncbi:MAG TPA: hypothetical protein VF250_15695 [Conexibacter sp.]
MTRRPRPLAVVLALTIAAGAADLAHAAPAPLALGTDGDGVRLVQHGRPARLAIVLSPRRHRAVAGRQLLIICAPVPEVTLGGGVPGRPPRTYRSPPRPREGDSARVRVPRRRGPILTPIAPGWDWCGIVVRRVVRSVRSRTTSDRPFATIPLTPAGAAFADEREAAFRVIVGWFYLELIPEPRRFTVRRAARYLHAVVLASPAEAPPPGRLGLYSDGRRHHYAAQSDRAGDLLFLERDGEVTRTNLLRYLQDDVLLWGANPFPWRRY